MQALQKRFCGAFYWAKPDIVMVKPKDDRVPASDGIVNVSVAGMTAPGCRVLLSLFHVNVKAELALAGIHWEVVKLRDSAMSPVFFM
jgi:hypothetical protein